MSAWFDLVPLPITVVWPTTRQALVGGVIGALIVAVIGLGIALVVTNSDSGSGKGSSPSSSAPTARRYVGDYERGADAKVTHAIGSSSTPA